MVEGGGGGWVGEKLFQSPVERNDVFVFNAKYQEDLVWQSRPTETTPSGLWDIIFLQVATKLVFLNSCVQHAVHHSRNALNLKY